MTGESNGRKVTVRELNDKMDAFAARMDAKFSRLYLVIGLVFLGDRGIAKATDDSSGVAGVVSLILRLF